MSPPAAPPPLPAMLLCSKNREAHTALAGRLQQLRWFEEDQPSDRDGFAFFTAHELGDALLQYRGQGVNRILETALGVYRSLCPQCLSKQSRLSSRLTGEVAELDRALLGSERAFWFIHWVGAWVGQQLTTKQQTGPELTSMIKELHRCSPQLEFWSVGHGIAWHYMASNALLSLDPRATAALGLMLCFKEMAMYPGWCYHGLGHGLTHAVVLNRTQPVGYGVNRQFLQVPMTTNEYDVAIRLCCGMPMAETAGCVHGVAHAFFNWRYRDASFGREDWFAWCASRLWPSFCFRDLFEYAPLSFHGVAKAGRVVHVEWLMLVKARPAELYEVPGRHVERCMSLHAELQPSCMFGIIGSHLNLFIRDAKKFCLDPQFLNKTAVIDTCLMPHYKAWSKRGWRGGRVPDCEASFGRHGASCHIAWEDIAWSSGYIATACPSSRCPYLANGAQSAFVLAPRGHRMDGHMR